jgi:WD repeat-containing protein 19
MSLIFHTGKRITLADWAECPGCKFACSARQFGRILAVERRCPMCNDEIGMDAVRKILDPIGALRKKQEAVAGVMS